MPHHKHRAGDDYFLLSPALHRFITAITFSAPWRSLALTFTIFMLTCQLPASTVAVFSQKDCRDLGANSHCQCSTMPSRFEIQCPPMDFNQKFTLQISPGEHVQIECNQVDAREYKLLPRMSIGVSKIVQIRHCPLPGHMSIARVFEHLGITKVNYLMFESGDLGANLTRVHLSDLENLAHLRFSSNSLTHMPEDLFTDLSNLNWLDLRSNNVNLTEKLFEPLKNLTFLELGHNNLKTLPRGIFKNQQKLLHLNLWGNQLRNLTKDVFEDATSLTDIDLSANNIETFAPDVFQPLTNLSIIYINANHIRELPYGLLANNKNLTEFRLINNRVALITLPSALFANLPHLKDVRLTCELEMVPEDLFANSTRLANLTMKENMLTTLPEKLLIDQRDLYDLDLTYNRLQTLPDGLFQNTRYLVELKLSHNKLTQISSELFNPLINLEVLQLDNNNLFTINIYAFRDTANLKFLNLENNKIDLTEAHPAVLDSNLYLNPDFDTNSPFQSLSQLQELNLRNNSIMYIFNDWKTQLLELQKLDISYNRITIFYDQDLQFLSKHGIQVNLTHNLIHEINFNSINIIDMPFADRVVRIDLNDNPLQCDCLMLPFLQFLSGEFKHKFEHKVDLLTSNLKCDGPPALQDKHMRELNYMELLCPLDSSSTNEKRCPHGCECWVRPYDLMLQVNCSNGNMTFLPPLPHVEQLKGIELFVEHNNIVRLPTATTTGYADVKRLHAAGNHLRQIEAYNLPPGLEYLDVRHNRMQRLNTSVLNLLNSSSTIKGLLLAHNAWLCDCDAKPLLEFTQSASVLQKLSVRDFNEMRCIADPANPQNVLSFKDISVADICPNEMGLVIAFGIIIALFGLLIGIAVALYYKYNQEIKVYLYAHNWCLWLVTEEELDKDKKYDAFVSYSHKDEAFIADYLVPELEHGPIPFKLCVHVRDFIVGGCIPEQIVRSVDESRRTIVVLSQNFIESVWARMEFRAAHQSALNEKRSRLIVIIYSDIDNIDNLDSELQAYLKTNTYLKWGDPYFWDKLRYAMPHPSRKAGCGGLEKTNIKSSVDDKLELIKPSPVTPSPTTPPAIAAKNPLIAHLNGGTPQTAIIIPNGKMTNGNATNYHMNGKAQNGHINGAFIINTNAKQSDV